MAPHLTIINYPSGVGKNVSPPIYIDDRAQDDLKSFIDHSGQRSTLAAQFEKRLQFLHKHRKNAHVFNGSWFEDLSGKNNPGIYCIRFNRIAKLGNLRILYFFDGESIILTHTFQERSGTTKRDYKKALEVASERRKSYA